MPHDLLRELRLHAPLARVDEVDLWRRDQSRGLPMRGSGYWAVLSHSAVTAVSRQPEIFSSALRGAFLPDPRSPQDLERTRQFLISMDAPEHTRIRRAVTDAFTPRAVRLLQDQVRRHAQALVDAVVARGELDIVADLAAELPLLVLADLLGMPPEDRRLLHGWSNSLVGFDDPEMGGGNVERYQRTFSDAFRYALDLLRAKRRDPRDDLMSQMAARGLSDSEFCHLWFLLVVGGNESTRHLLSGMLQALWEWPEERRRLAADESLIPTAVEELLRWVSPVMQFRRTATRDVELEGHQVRAGDKLVLYYIAANRDEAVFERPDRLDLGRTPNPHLAFGVGPHFCLGAHLSRFEAASLLTALRPHLVRLSPAGPPTRMASNFMNGWKSLPARFAS